MMPSGPAGAPAPTQLPMAVPPLNAETETAAAFDDALPDEGGKRIGRTRV